MFQRLRPTQRTFTTTNGNFSSTSLILANQVEVFLPEDLGAVVAPDSDTMRAARASIAARNKQSSWTYAYLAAAVVDTCLFSGLSPVEPDSRLSEAIVWPLAIAAALVPYLVSRHYGRVDLDERQRAFAAYPRDLGARLNVCAHGLEVVPCEAYPPPLRAAR